MDGQVPESPVPGADAAPSATTRQRLLQAATRVFARRGYHRATVDEIVAEAGISKGAFYFHFPSKEALFFHLVEHFATRMATDIQQAVEQARGAQSRVEAALRAGVRTFSQHPELARVFLVESAAASPEFEQRRRAFYDRFCWLIQTYLDQAVRDGDIPPLDTELAARAILGAVAEVVAHRLASNQPNRLQDDVPELARFILRGAGWRLSP